MCLPKLSDYNLKRVNLLSISVKVNFQGGEARKHQHLLEQPHSNHARLTFK